MIQINKVDSLKKGQRDKVLYEDLEPGQPFVFDPKYNYRMELRFKTKEGHYDPSDGDSHLQNGYLKESVIHVDAEINWCLKETP